MVTNPIHKAIGGHKFLIAPSVTPVSFNQYWCFTTIGTNESSHDYTTGVT